MPPISDVVSLLHPLTAPEVIAICCALVMGALDVVIGVVGAAVRGDIQSAKIREGLGHKALVCLVIVMAVVGQTCISAVGDEFGVELPMVVPVCAAVVLMEVTSVIESVALAVPDLADSPLLRLFRGKDK